ncbi:MAG: carboxypeptidase-like regulatory domain-containing protein, partial [Saprospiraceae bacterium]
MTDEKGEALIGASILAKGTSTGTVTDVDGKFSLNLPAGADALVISYTGFSTQEVTVGNQTTLSISLVEGVMLETAV